MANEKDLSVKVDSDLLRRFASEAKARSTTQKRVIAEFLREWLGIPAPEEDERLVKLKRLVENIDLDGQNGDEIVDSIARMLSLFQRKT